MANKVIIVEFEVDEDYNVSEGDLFDYLYHMVISRDLTTRPSKDVIRMMNTPLAIKEARLA